MSIVSPSAASIIRRLAGRSDVPPDVIATLHSVAELTLLERQDGYNQGLRDGEARGIEKAQRGMIR